MQEGWRRLLKKDALLRCYVSRDGSDGFHRCLLTGIYTCVLAFNPQYQRGFDASDPENDLPYHVFAKFPPSSSAWGGGPLISNGKRWTIKAGRDEMGSRGSVYLLANEGSGNLVTSLICIRQISPPPPPLPPSPDGPPPI